MALSADRADTLRSIKQQAYHIRHRNLVMIHDAGLGHLGGDLSATDILATLFFGVLSLRSDEPDWPERDRFILSKGHCSGALYNTMARRGFMPESELTTFIQPGSRLSGHPDRNKLPGIESNTGPLGHGLPIGVGCALGAKVDRADWRTFVLTGDGELQEGSNWEAAMSAAHYKLDNLTVIVDRNGLQLGDRTENTMALDPLADKWRAFGWQVVELDGHDHGQLYDALSTTPVQPNSPTCIIAHTHKGHGVSFGEDNPAWHHHVPDNDELARALAELDAHAEKEGLLTGEASG